MSDIPFDLVTNEKSNLYVTKKGLTCEYIISSDKNRVVFEGTLRCGEEHYRPNIYIFKVYENGLGQFIAILDPSTSKEDHASICTVLGYNLESVISRMNTEIIAINRRLSNPNKYKTKDDEVREFMDSIKQNQSSSEIKYPRKPALDISREYKRILDNQNQFREDVERNKIAAEMWDAQKDMNDETL